MKVKRTKGKHLMCELTDAEHEEIWRRVKDSGLSLRDFVVSVCLRGDLPSNVRRICDLEVRVARLEAHLATLTASSDTLPTP